MVREHVDDTDLLRLRNLKAKLVAADLFPEGIGFEGIVALYEEHYEFMGELAARYGLDEDEEWMIYPATGMIESGP